MMRYEDKRELSQDLALVQSDNRSWWTDHTMSYDWMQKIGANRFSKEWFDELDRRFIYAARLFAHDRSPFDRIIPFERLRGRKVLEIGCGMGLHSELISCCGGDLTAIDLSETSVLATRTRAQLKNLKYVVRQMDAEELEFPDQSFDFVWSWGVIHHSSQTGRIIREIHRVLKPGGEVRVMVYNLEGMAAYVTILRRYLLGFWRNKSLDRYLWQDTDGFMARHYSRDLLADTFNTFFRNTSVASYGQDADAVPLPRYVRKFVVPLISEKKLSEWANKRGTFLHVTATK
jgi:2-polyprenyl-3-methyl-5-hydroxy-6-metoxy-1,4-benzoquinol methylase